MPSPLYGGTIRDEPSLKCLAMIVKAVGPPTEWERATRASTMKEKQTWITLCPNEISNEHHQCGTDCKKFQYNIGNFQFADEKDLPHKLRYK